MSGDEVMAFLSVPARSVPGCPVYYNTLKQKTSTSRKFPRPLA
jgi:hypothetical protein